MTKAPLRHFARLAALSLCATLAAKAAPAAPPAPAAVALDAKDQPAVPGNWTLGEREHWQRMQKEIEQYASLLNTSCETSISVTFDHETFRGKLMEPGKTGLAASPFWTHATQALGSVRELCLRGGPGKAAVKAKITKIVIEHAGASRAHKIDRGKLSAVVDPGEAPRQWQTKFQEFLKQSLLSRHRHPAPEGALCGRMAVRAMAEEVRFLFVCDRRFEALEGDDAGRRHCAQCDTPVHNLDAMGEAERAALFERARGEKTTVCVSASFSREGASACRAGGFASPLGPAGRPHGGLDAPAGPAPDASQESGEAIDLVGSVEPVALVGSVSAYRPPEWRPARPYDPPAPGLGCASRDYAVDVDTLASTVEHVCAEFGLVAGAPAGWLPPEAGEQHIWHRPRRFGALVCYEVSVTATHRGAALSLRATSGRAPGNWFYQPGRSTWALTLLFVVATAAGALLALGRHKTFAIVGVALLAVALFGRAVRALFTLWALATDALSRPLMAPSRDRFAGRLFAAVERGLRRPSPYR